MTLLDRHDLLADQMPGDTQNASVGQHPLANDQVCRDTQSSRVVGDFLSTDHASGDTHRKSVGADLLPAPITLAKPIKGSAQAPSPTAANVAATPNDQPPLSGSSSQPPKRLPHTQRSTGGWLELRLCADLFERAQQERIAVANVIRKPTEGGNIDPAFFIEHLARLEATEHQAQLMLGRCFKRVVPKSIRDWQADNRGIGQHLLGRLLGRLGDPRIATPHYWEGTGADRVLMEEEPRPRTVGQLWQLCGHGAPGRVTKGMTADELAHLGSPTMKMVVHLLAEACMKQPSGNRYRDIYEQRRIVTVDRVHAAPCVRCGPSGKPAVAGTPWSKGHQMADAQRIVGKELLRDLWAVAS